MSNELAIATVTAALKDVVEAAVKPVDGAGVHLGRPDTTVVEQSDPMAGLYLYQVRPNVALRNSWQPLRGGNGKAHATPRVALDLHYLISFYGDGKKFYPERMAAEVVRSLEVVPVLTRKLVKAVSAGDPLKDSDLHAATETVKATPIAMDLEELSKLWSIFFQVPYCLSLPFVCSYVVIEAEREAGPALPVTRPSIHPMPVSRVALDTVESAKGPSAPILWGDNLRIRGAGLAKTGLGVRIDGSDVVMPATERGTDEFVLPLQAGTFGGAELPAGLRLLQLVDPAPAGVPARFVRTTDPVSLKLRPKLAVSGPTLQKITVTFTPRVAQGQVVRLLLDEMVYKDPKSYVLKPESPAGAFPLAQLSFSTAAVAAGKYLVSAQVDEVYSAPQVETDPTSAQFGQIKGPEVNVS